MSLIPEEELQKQGSLNLAPMVDFLFLVIAVFAVLAVSRAALYDGEVHLVKLTPADKKMATPTHQDTYIVNLSVTEKGQYKWITEANEYLLDSVYAIEPELIKQQELGLLPQEKEKTKILLHIDKKAEWEPVAKAIFAVRGAGFQVHPVYELDDSL